MKSENIHLSDSGRYAFGFQLNKIESNFLAYRSDEKYGRTLCSPRWHRAETVTDKRALATCKGCINSKRFNKGIEDGV